MCFTITKYICILTIDVRVPAIQGSKVWTDLAGTTSEVSTLLERI